MAKSVKRVRGVSAGATSLSPKILSAYKQILSFQFVGTMILAVCLSVWLLAAHIRGWEVPVLVLVVLLGILGAFFSALTRLYKVDEAGAALISPTVEHLGGRYLLMYSFVPPVIGAIAAVVLYLIFIGKLLNGVLFPEIGCVTGKGMRDHSGPDAQLPAGARGGLRQGAGLVLHRRLLGAAGAGPVAVAGRQAGQGVGEMMSPRLPRCVSERAVVASAMLPSR